MVLTSDSLKHAWHEFFIGRLCTGAMMICLYPVQGVELVSDVAGSFRSVRCTLQEHDRTRFRQKNSHVLDHFSSGGSVDKNIKL